MATSNTGKKNLKIKKGDVVRVIAGKDKGAEGRVISVHPEQARVVVEGVNRIKRHTKVVNQGGRAGTTGGIITREAAIHVSNVMLLVDASASEDAEGGEKAAKGKVTTRVGYRRDEVSKRRPDGSTYPALRSTRIARKSGKEI
ncbi:MAG TPA: 50S ribosomal protein L24 [Nocardioidaceae bacterium]|nr:50S ribosomal protein L24 [Nocardioidaceae bacterium]